MDVKLEAFISRSIDGAREVRPKLCRVRVDGMHVGFIGWKPGSKLMLHKRFTPPECREIEDKIKPQLEDFLNREVPSVEVRMPSEHVIDVNLEQEEDDADVDDFDS